MHNIEPYSSWLKYYDAANDERSPFYGKEYNFDLYSETIYNHYIDPWWDFMGSETLYIKILYTDYDLRCSIIELLGEWNDALYNDIMHLKRNVIEPLQQEGIEKFILIGENVFNFHGSDDSYYEEWYEETEGEGWLTAIGFRDFVLEEWKKYNVDGYFNFGGELEIDNWRTYNPKGLIKFVENIIRRRLG